MRLEVPESWTFVNPQKVLTLQVGPLVLSLVWNSGLASWLHSVLGVRRRKKWWRKLGELYLGEQIVGLVVEKHTEEVVRRCQDKPRKKQGRAVFSRLVFSACRSQSYTARLRLHTDIKMCRISEIRPIRMSEKAPALFCALGMVLYNTNQGNNSSSIRRPRRNMIKAWRRQQNGLSMRKVEKGMSKMWERQFP